MYVVKPNLITIIKNSILKKLIHKNPILKKLCATTLTAAICAPVGLQAGDTTLPEISTLADKPFDPAGTVNIEAGVNSTAINPVMDIIHSADKTVLNWDSFDIGKNSTVNFKQLSSSSLTLNRINQQSTPSQIFGNLNANGRIYLINQNGILFGEGSQVNVNELTASTLDVTDRLLEEGILTALRNNEAAFFEFKDGNGNPLTSSDIIIEKGAEIKTASGGRVMLIAPNVENSGVIKTPDGQTIIAAGKKVYLAVSEDAGLRGFLVEIDSGGTATNLGEIIAERGNVTLTGLTVNQNNRITATTTVNTNGSIRLQARDTVEISGAGDNVSIISTNTGKVNLGDDSVTQILSELDDESTAIDAQKQYKSSVTITGEKIHFKQNSLVEAKGGEVIVEALENPANKEPDVGQVIQRKDDVVIQFEEGSKIDVSGNSLTKEMSSNNIKVELRGNEFKNSPVQRDGVLRGEEVTIDIRKVDGFDLADISGALGTVERNVAERTSEGGSVLVNSEGEIRFLEGAEIDVSGGIINYKEGYVETTILDNNGKLIDIHDADKNIIYDGIFKKDQKIFESAYKEGRDAGIIQFAAHGIIADGNLIGSSEAGRYQRNQNNLPKGGKLIIGLPDGQSVLDFRAPNIDFGDKSLKNIIGGYTIGIDESLRNIGSGEYYNKLILNDALITEGGFSRVNLNSNGKVTINGSKKLEFSPASEFSIRAERIDINRSIENLGGSLSFNASGSSNRIDINDETKLGIFISDNLTFDVSGNWTNDLPIVNNGKENLSTIIKDAGSIFISSGLTDGEIVTGNNSNFLMFGGAHVNSIGELSYGDGGDFSLSMPLESKLNFGSNTNIMAYGAANGGTFSLSVPAIAIKNSNVSDWLSGQIIENKNEFILPDFIFNELGFSDFNLSTNIGDFIIESGSNIKLETVSLFFPSDALTKKSSKLNQVFLSSTSNNLLNYRESPLDNNLIGSVNGQINWIKGNSYLGKKPERNSLGQKLNLNISAPTSFKQIFDFQQGAKIQARNVNSKISINNSTGGKISMGGELIAPSSEVDVSLSRDSSLAFDNTHAIIFGENSVIDLKGKVIELPNQLGLKKGKVYDAGDINVESSGFIVVNKGAKVDASGVEALLDVSGGIKSPVITRKNIAGNAGSISYTSGEGIIDLGTKVLTPGNNTALGGEITYKIGNEFRGGEDLLVANTFNFDYSIEVSQKSNLNINNISVGDAIDENLYSGKAFISVNNLLSYVSDDKIINSGLDNLNLINSLGEIRFNGDVKFSAEGIDNAIIRNGIVLDASLISSDGGKIEIYDTNNIQIGSTKSISGLASSSNLSSGELQITNVNNIDLVGGLTVAGINSVKLLSNESIRLIGVTSENSGELNLNGDLDLTADQVFTSSKTKYAINAGDNDTVNINPGDGVSSVYTVGGELEINAGDINNKGTIKVPLGSITLNAKNNLNLDEGSILSIASDYESILLGNLSSTGQWTYGNEVIFSKEQNNIPNKKITLNGNVINVKEGSLIDVSSQGEVKARQFIPGPGGSADQLLASQFVIDNETGKNISQGNYFAVIPEVNGNTVFDSREFSGWDLSVGESIFLAGGEGLEAGVYTKLPASYALIEGAYLIEAVDGFENLPLNDRLPLNDGVLVSGYSLIQGTPISDNQTSGFIIHKGDYANQLSEYDIRNADDFIIDTATNSNIEVPGLIRDAGSLVINGISDINLNGAIESNVNAGARGALVDITSNLIDIVEQKSINKSSGVVELEVSGLEKLNAGSLLIGGVRTRNTQGTEIKSTSSRVRLKNDVELKGNEIILTASDEVEIQSGATLKSIGSVSKGSSENVVLDGGSALARVSNADDIIIERINANDTANLILAENSNIESVNSITLDSSGSVDFKSGFNVSDSGAISLGGSNINIGDVPDGLDGLILDSKKLKELENIDLKLRSNNGITFYGNVEMNQQTLEFNTSGLISNKDNIADVIINAEKLILNNQDNFSFLANADNQAGQISFNPLDDVKNPSQTKLEQLVLAGGDFSFDGFASVSGVVNGDIVAEKDFDLNIINGNLTFDSSRITALSGAEFDIVANEVKLGSVASIQEPAENNSLGAGLNIVANSIDFDTFVEMQSGNINLNAIGETANNQGKLYLGNNAKLDVSGVSINVKDLNQVNTRAGAVFISSENGDVNLDTNSIIRADAAGSNGYAGKIKINAKNGDVNLGGNLSAKAPVLFVDVNGVSVETKDLSKGGSIELDAKTYTQNFQEINSKLNQGEFFASRDLRFRTGSIDIQSDDIVKSQTIKITADGFGVSQDEGNIRVAGVLQSADENHGGYIQLNAANDLEINSGANIKAVTGSAEDGKIYLNSADGEITVNSGTTINSGNKGLVHLRAIRNQNNLDLKIKNFNPDSVVAKKVELEGYAIKDNVDSVSSALIKLIATETNNFIQNVAAIKTRLGLTEDHYHITPGIEIRNDGDISFDTEWDFNNFESNKWAYNGTAGTLTVRTPGNIMVKNNISDGVELTTDYARQEKYTSLIRDSWNYNLIAGAEDVYSADILNVSNRSTSKFIVNDGNDLIDSEIAIRTGSGDINILASGNVEIDEKASIYALGKRSDFDLDIQDGIDSYLPVQLVPTDGGDVYIRSGGDVVASRVDNKVELANEWFKKQSPRPGRVRGNRVILPQIDGGNYIDLISFNSGVANFGGGKVSVEAGNNISNLSVSSPSYVTSDFNTREVSRREIGEISVYAKNDILGGNYFIGDGKATIVAGKNIISEQGGGFSGLDTLVAAMGGAVDIYAGKNIELETVYDPNSFFESTNIPSFVSYTNDTKVVVTSLVNDIYIGLSGSDIKSNSNLDISDASRFNIFPGDVSFSALSGNVNVSSGGLIAYPSGKGGFSVYAKDSFINQGAFILPDTNASLVPTINEPAFLVNEFADFVNTRLFANTPRYIDDSTSSYFIAEEGDIIGGTYVLGESAIFSSGRDLKDIFANIQNVNETDVTVFSAGRDILQVEKNNLISVAGPGRVEVIAGANIDLGESLGIETKGNLDNGNLTEKGADLLVMAGVGAGPNYLDFYNNYLSQNNISNAEWNDIKDQQIESIVDLFFNELVAAGRDETGDFSRGFRAIDVLFPETGFERVDAYDPVKLSLKIPTESKSEYFERLSKLSLYQGDISMFSSRIYTLDGGDINILSPGGLVNAGLPISTGVDKNLGLVAQSTGSIRSFTRGNFQVNQSRVSTLLGGDIIMWSSIGDIDAGRGSKSAVSAPEPQITVTADGSIKVDLSNTISGSGIRAVVVDPSVDPGDVDLIAPNGIVDAGDAGIASSGNINIAAQAVLGADNIQVGGVAVGVPASSDGGVSTAGIGGTGDVTRAATQEAVDSSQEDAAPDDGPVEEAPQLSFISVEILGFGYDDVLEEDEDEDEEEEENAEVSYIKPENAEDLG